jgi:D-tyrosyl-tRNA(Tyr) deacylase
MRALLQRTAQAAVEVDGQTVGQIGRGLLILAAAGPDDGPEDVELLARKIVHLRIFADDQGKFNRSLLEVAGQALVVSQFTLYADCRKGRRPSFAGAAPPDRAEQLIEALAGAIRALGVATETGRFGAMMRVQLVNDGPVTIWLDTREWKP